MKDARGAWRSLATAALTKSEARRLAGDLERRAERQRLGLEPVATENLSAKVLCAERVEIIAVVETAGLAG